MTVRGLQEFTLPPFWAALDPWLAPAIKDALVEDSYRRFFTATLDNVEACYEGREFRVGRDREPADDEPPEERFKQTWSVMRQVLPDRPLDALVRQMQLRAAPQAHEVDEDGFRHFDGGRVTRAGSTEPPAWSKAVRGWFDEWAEILAEDATNPPPEELIGMRTAVTGANGLLGAHVVRALQEAGHQPVAVVRERADLRGLTGVDVPLARADTRSRGDLHARVRRRRARRALRRGLLLRHGRDAIWSEPTSTAPASDEAAAEAGVRRVVLTSSSVTCGSSAGPLQRDETAASRTSGCPTTSAARCAGAGGVRDRRGPRRSSWSWPAPPWSSAARTGGWCRATRSCPALPARPDPQHIPRAAATWSRSATWRAGTSCSAERGKPGERYLLGGENLGWRMLHTLVAELAGVAGRTSPGRAARLAGGVGGRGGRPAHR